jgi:hypothetical protein
MGSRLAVAGGREENNEEPLLIEVGLLSGEMRISWD